MKEYIDLPRFAILRKRGGSTACFRRRGGKSGAERAKRKHRPKQQARLGVVLASYLAKARVGSKRDTDSRYATVADATGQHLDE